jgi:hypothetical protein
MHDDTGALSERPCDLFLPNGTMNVCICLRGCIGMTGKLPYGYHSSAKSRLHARIRAIDKLVLKAEEYQSKKSPLPRGVKLIILLAVIIFLFVCSVPVFVFLRLLFR